MPDVPNNEQDDRLRDLASQADERRRIGDVEGEAALWHEWLTVCEPGTAPPLRTSVLRRLAEIRDGQGDVAEAISLLSQALEAADVQRAPADSVAMLAELGRLYLAAGRMDEALDGFRRARDLAGQTGQAVAAAIASAAVGRITFENGDRDAGVQDMLAGLRELVAGGADEGHMLYEEMREVADVMGAERFRRAVDRAGLPGDLRTALLKSKD